MSIIKNLRDFSPVDEEEKLATELASKILLDAIASRSSDIHIEPRRGDYAIKYRIDGMLQEISSHPHVAIASLLRVMKKIAVLDPDLSVLPQDGKFSYSTPLEEDREMSYDLRVATIPASFGENLVIRILDPDKADFLKGNFECLDFTEEELVNVKEMLRKPYGAIIFTGPTGCGKTTTAYASLSYLAKALRDTCSIISVEDPVEMHLDGIVQINVESGGDFNYLKALKALMKQDPDIIFCGEIQSPEVARQLIMISLAGHLVLSQLHAPDVAQALIRLTEMGIEPYLVGMSIEGIIAQRLVRKICPHCRERVKNSRAAIEHLREDFEGIERLETTFRGRGCEKCHRSGYLGRTAIYEIFPGDKRIQDIMARNLSLLELRRHLREMGYPSLRHNALEKIVQGITSMEEAVRWSLV